MESEQAHIVNDKEHVSRLLQQMQEAVTYYCNDKTNTPTLLEKVPLFVRFMKGSTEISNQAVQASSAIQGLTTPTGVSNGFQFGSVGFAAFDFLLIPFIYLSAYISNQKVPFTVTNNAKWGYAAVVLGLAITAAIVPGAAPIIGIVSATLAVVCSTALLGKALYERYQLGREKRALRREVSGAEDEMQLIQTEANALEGLLQTTMDHDSLVDIYRQTESLKERYEAQKTHIQELKEKEGILNKKVKELSLLPMLDKGFAVSFSAIAVIGAVVSLFFPPVGLGILMGVTVASFSYFIGRLMPLIIDAAKSLLNKLWPTSTTAALEHENEPLLTPQHQPPQSSHDNSTVCMLHQLVGDEDEIKSQQCSVAESETILEPTEELTHASDSSVDETEDNSIDAPPQMR